MSKRPAEVFYYLMSKAILFIDGENFTYKIEQVLKGRKIDKSTVDLSLLDLNQLFKEPLKEFSISRKIFYNAKLHFYEETPRKSRELIRLQRKLRNTLINQGYEFVIAGNVRAQKVDGKTIFREKGVDVKIAVDLVALACDRKLQTAILCSSDSDLQPAIAELRKRKVRVIYLGFETNPNKGLAYTTNKTILLRNPQILSSYKKVK